MSKDYPILYSFRRCPYAMRARLAIASAGLRVALREVVLRDKAPAFLAASDSGTVPCLLTSEGAIDESLDIMRWALAQHDPEGWMDMPPEGWMLISRADGPFKDALDRTKYATRYEGGDPLEQRAKASEFLAGLDGHLSDGWLFGVRPSLADFAILPFVRQFANVDRSWFDAQDWPRLRGWLDGFLGSPQFTAIMLKYPKWQAGDPITVFPDPEAHKP